MGIQDILMLVLGLSLFLFGMNVMSAALKKSAGNRLKHILGELTSSQPKGFLLGLLVTAIIQSSSATTVMVVGFVNSGTMTLTQSVGVIMGANVGTAVTSWLTGLSGLGSSGEAMSMFLQWLKPDSWIPLLAIAGLILTMFSKRERRKDVGNVLFGFTVLMVGMEYMSASVSILKNNEGFQDILIMFSNPVLGVLAGLVLTTIVQSSSASVGILQSLTTTGAITYGAAIPIIMGQNIGTCVTALISAIGAGKNGRRAALIHLYFNIIGVVVWLSIYYLLESIIGFQFANNVIDMWGVAAVHTVFKILCVGLMAPFTKQLERLAILSIPASEDEENVRVLDERLLGTPAVALSACDEAAISMAKDSIGSVRLSLGLLKAYDEQTAQRINLLENRVDDYEDMIGSYLIQLPSSNMTEQNSHEVTKLLHIIGDLERLSDHAVNLVESAQEIQDKNIHFDEATQASLDKLMHAIDEILGYAMKAFIDEDMNSALLVEPLEQVIDIMRDKSRSQHIARLASGESTTEMGFILSDLLTNLERIADHCSNIAACMIEVARNSLDMHGYLTSITDGKNAQFTNAFEMFKKHYDI